MTGKEIVEQVRDASDGFQVTCRKFAGAVTAELLKKFLAEEGISTSARDVYIQGIPLEIDLIIPRRGQKPKFGLVYQPTQVAAALEIKKNGSFGEPTLLTVKQNFNRLRGEGVKCAYVAIEERKTFCWKATEENIGGFPCFTLCWHKGDNLTDTKDWERLLTFLRGCASNGS